MLGMSPSPGKRAALVIPKLTFARKQLSPKLEYQTMVLVMTLFGLVIEADPSQAFGLEASITVNGEAGCAKAKFKAKTTKAKAVVRIFFTVQFSLKVLKLIHPTNHRVRRKPFEPWKNPQ